MTALRVLYIHPRKKRERNEEKVEKAGHKEESKDVSRELGGMSRRSRTLTWLRDQRGGDNRLRLQGRNEEEEERKKRKKKG